MEATAKDLRYQTKKILDTAARGEEVIVTYRGKPYVKIVQLIDKSPTEDDFEHPLFGLWKDDPESENVNDYIDKLREGRRFE